MQFPERMMYESVKIRTYLGSTGTGARYTEAVTYPARISYENKLIRTSTGKEIVSASSVILPARARGAARIASKITLPGETFERTIEAGGLVMGMRSISHVKVDLA